MSARSRIEWHARERTQARIEELAERLRALIAHTSVEIEGSRIVVAGRGLTRRWLSDPDLRFLFRGQP